MVAPRSPFTHPRDLSLVGSSPQTTAPFKRDRGNPPFPRYGRPLKQPHLPRLDPPRSPPRLPRLARLAHRHNVFRRSRRRRRPPKLRLLDNSSYKPLLHIHPTLPPLCPHLDLRCHWNPCGRSFLRSVLYTPRTVLQRELSGYYCGVVGYDACRTGVGEIFGSVDCGVWIRAYGAYLYDLECGVVWAK